MSSVVTLVRVTPMQPPSALPVAPQWAYVSATGSFSGPNLWVNPLSLEVHFAAVLASRLLYLIPIACPLSCPIGPLGAQICLLPGLLRAARGGTSRGGGPGLLLCGFRPTLPGGSPVLCPLRGHGSCHTRLLMCGLWVPVSVSACLVGGGRYAMCLAAALRGHIDATSRMACLALWVGPGSYCPSLPGILRLAYCS